MLKKKTYYNQLKKINFPFLFICNLGTKHLQKAIKKEEKTVPKLQPMVRNDLEKAQMIEIYGNGRIIYEKSQRGNKLLHFEGHKYIKNNIYGQNIYWKCTKWHSGCKARAITHIYDIHVCSTRNVHNHFTADFNQDV